MKKIELQAQKRTVIGKKVKTLRKAKLLPGNVFGKGVASLSVQVPVETFAKVYAQSGKTGLIELVVDGKNRPVLIQNVQIHAVSGVPLHVDFYQVDLKTKVKANVPLELVGIAPAVTEKLGLLLELLDEIEVEALPADLPENITVDVGKLNKVHDAVKVSDLILPGGVLVLTDKETEIVKVGELITKEAQSLAAEEAAQKAAAEAQTAQAAVAPVEPVTTKATEEAKTEKKA